MPNQESSSGHSVFAYLQITSLPMPSFHLKRKHYVSQLFFADPLPLAQLANGIVLAEQTSKVAVGEEYGSGTVAAHERALVAEVGSVARYHCLARGAALACPGGQPIHTAVAGTHRASLEQRQSRLTAIPQPPATVK